MANIGKWITRLSVILLILSVAPILLYAAFGPADGNPVGLGLLGAFGIVVFGGATFIGAVIWLIGIFLEKPRNGEESL